MALFRESTDTCSRIRRRKAPCRSDCRLEVRRIRLDDKRSSTNMMAPMKERWVFSSKNTKTGGSFPLSSGLGCIATNMPMPTSTPLLRLQGSISSSTLTPIAMTHSHAYSVGACASSWLITTLGAEAK